MKNAKKGIFVLIILLAVGFAAVTATLVINGTSIFGTNDDNFDVIFTRAIIDYVDKSSEVISEDGKSITYTTKELAIKDDKSVLDFTVKNNSTQYDAEVSIECIGGASVGTYYKIDKNVAEVIPAQTEDVGKVTVTMIKSSTEPIEEVFTCTITATAIERETEAEIVPACEPVTTCNEVGDVCWTDSDCSGDKNIGDVVSLGTDENSIEQFYIVTYTEESTEMMSMYNLYVGAECTGETSDTCTAYENPTGIQDSTMRGYTPAGYPHKGVTAFSSNEQKGTNYSDYVGSIVEGYVNNYSDYISDTLGIENTATLISKEEIEAIVGQTLIAAEYLSDMGAPEFLYSTSYWTRSAIDTYLIWDVYAGGGFLGNAHYYYDNAFGVRPVVTIDSDQFTKTLPVCTLENPTVECNADEDVCWTDVDCSGDKNLGDIMALGTSDNSIEEFYILSSDETTTQMLSKYNLYVGGESYNENGTWINTKYENPTGIQDPTMKGYFNGEDVSRGITAFSNVSNQYSGSLVEGYVNNYSNYISNTLGIANTATLITREELENLGCSSETFMCTDAPSFLYSTSYWTRTPSTSEMYVWSVYSVNYYADTSFNVELHFGSNSGYSYGVRPVVNISSSLV